MNDKKLFTIGVLFLSAIVLMIANILPMPAQAADAVKERDFTVVTAHVTQGGEGLYIVDNRTGMMAVFTWDTAARTIVLRIVRPVTDAFN